MKRSNGIVFIWHINTGNQCNIATTGAVPTTFQPLDNNLCSICWGGGSDDTDGFKENYKTQQLRIYQVNRTNLYKRHGPDLTARQCQMPRVGIAETTVSDRCRRVHRQLTQIRWTIYCAWTKQSRQDQQLKGCHNLCIQRIPCCIHKFIFTSSLWLCQIKKMMQEV